MKFIDESGVIWVMEPSPYGGGMDACPGMR